MKTYRIVKIVRANNMFEILKNESPADIKEITEIDENNETMGYD